MVEVINRGKPTNPTLVLLPGLGLGPDLWEPHLDALTKNFRVVAPELPGFGSFSGRGPFRFDDAASFVADLIGDDRGAAFVCGLSLGALVALQLTVDHPGRVRGLVLASGIARPNPRRRTNSRRPSCTLCRLAG
ncbi:alpha/beta fold hydrolase [Fodinicola feengrottensis]|uniref:alpha/beta fold hydrolase n=1 Tax=Fodinicola feengrottensis TaxID=435914 RepID=UPI0013D7F1CB|nr:alpha/beta hydrolase [Fodinicola feengrottensis]